MLFLGASVLALLYKGAYSEQLYNARLLSPVLPKHTTWCLTMKYLSKTQLLVSLLNIKGNNATLFQDKLINTYNDPIWTYMSIDIQNMDESSMVLIKAQKTESGYFQYVLMLNDIAVNEGSCMWNNYLGM